MAPARESNEGGARIAYRVVLRPGRERSVLRGHPWLYSGAIERIEARTDAAPGELGEILSATGDWLALATVQPEATLTAKILRFEPGAIDSAYFAAAFVQAAALRADVLPPGTDAYRLIHAEGDCLPGLVIDRYGDFLVVQCLSAGMSRLQSFWLPALRSTIPARGIYEKAEHARRDAGLARVDGVLDGEAPPEILTIHEHGHRFEVRLATGQKTGFYLDQRENRAQIATLARGRRMLDAFCYGGAFGVHAAAAGAAHVTALDTSARALEQVEANWKLNDLPLERLRATRTPAQDFLRQGDERFDLIVLDPPAFAKEHGEIDRAARAYKDLNLRALRRLAPGGYLATFSCSQHVTVDLFQKILFAASLDARRRVQWVRRLGAGPDHPVHLHHPQGEYLKGFLLHALEDEERAHGEGSLEPGTD
jgi:23S rRNA (cytosine1962-C5)-methyltransferase